MMVVPLIVRVLGLSVGWGKWGLGQPREELAHIIVSSMRLSTHRTLLSQIEVGARLHVYP